MTAVDCGEAKDEDSLTAADDCGVEGQMWQDGQ